MINVSRTFTVDKPADVVVAYLADFGNAEQWDPGTVSCTRADSGPVQVGSTWNNVSKVLGRETTLDYRLERLEPGRVTLVGRNDTATSTDDITVRPSGGGSEVTYDATVELNGLAKLAYPVMRLEFRRLANKTEAQIKAAVAGL
ncbi:MAG: SRPBCC family protein [Geodermatophilaceae bacterium]